jgi:hypothetical protein
MPAKNKPTLRVFNGEHPYFIDGEAYTVKEYSNWTLRYCPNGGVIASTLKGRLEGIDYCEPKHLLSVAEYYNKIKEVQNRKGYTKESREKVRNQPRLETASERLSQKWRRVKL